MFANMCWSIDCCNDYSSSAIWVCCSGCHCEIAQENAAECYSSETEFEKCFNDFTDVGICCMKYKIKCNVFVYQRDENHSPCTSTSTTCPYSSSWEEKYINERGVPVTGLCPECSLANGGSGCAVKKSTKTFQVEQAGSRMHLLTPVIVSDGDLLGSNMQYVQVGLGTLGGQSVQCGRQETCSTLAKALEIQSGLFVCVPCLAAPIKHVWFWQSR